MISELSIENYKSIKKLKIPCKRVNIFIGEPNTGKSNILEALSFFSPGTFQKDIFNEVIRFKTLGDLFYDNKIKNPIVISTNEKVFSLSFTPDYFDEKEKVFQFRGEFDNPGKPPIRHDSNDTHSFFSLDQNGNILDQNINYKTNLRTYIFKRLKAFQLSFSFYLNAPFGENIPGLLLSNDELKKVVSDIFQEKGFKLMLMPTENDISMAKEVNEELYSYPYSTISETMQRIVFMMLAMESNKNATLVFDEPEANTFPFYTKFIAERMALDETNQFFITTHNPYLLTSLIEKTKLSDLNVFVATMKGYQTKLKLLNEKQLEKVLDMDPDVFFNLDRL